MKRLRLALVRERERQGLTQQEVARRADMRQGHLSNIENVDGLEMKDLAARVLFQVIEKGLGRNLGAFFAEMDQSSAGVPLAESGASSSATTEGRAHDDSVPAPPITPADLDRFARTIGRAIGREIRAPAVDQRPAKTRAHRPKRRARSE